MLGLVILTSCKYVSVFTSQANKKAHKLFKSCSDPTQKVIDTCVIKLYRPAKAKNQIQKTTSSAYFIIDMSDKAMLLVAGIASV